MNQLKEIDHESKKKMESGITGRYYERKILALIALKCLLKEDIIDFWITANPKDVDKFDDLILSVEYETKERELFMMQINHRDKVDRPIVADMFNQERQKKLYLQTYEKAYKDIIAANKYPGYMRKYFIFFNNCKVTTNEKHENLEFIPVDQNEFRDFISTNTIAYKFTDKTKKYKQSFLEEFYFYPEQIHENEINNEISVISGIEHEKIMFFIYKWADKKYITKLKRSDLLNRLLEIWFDHFQPPKNEELFNNKHSPLDFLRSFDVTIISNQSSKNFIWSDIQDEMKIYSIQNINICNESLQADIFDEKLYIDMVVERYVPFYIETNNRYFSSYQILLKKLKVSTIVFNSQSIKLRFPQLNVFTTMYNIKKPIFYDISKKIETFQGTRSLDLLTLSQTDSNIGKAITVDIFLDILKQPIKINENLKCPEIYISRNIKVPLIKRDFLMDNAMNGYFFIICDLNKKINGIETISLDNYFRIKNVGIHKLLECEPIKDCYLLHTSCKYNHLLLQMIKYSFIGKNIFYILKYLPKENRFLILYSNGSINIVKPHIKGAYPIKDEDLINLFGSSEVNVISNNAGMGKSMLLQFLYQRFDSSELVTYVNLEHIEEHELTKITDWKTLFNFFCRNHKTNIDYTVLEVLYNNRLKNNKLVWLVDNNGEFRSLFLLDLLKQAGKKGVKIWFVTRPSATIDFEMFFNSFAMELEQFNFNDQINFLQTFFQINKNDQETVRKKVNIFKHIRTKLEDNFIGNCQQTMMLAEIINKESNNNLENLTLPDIYEKFIDLKMRGYDESQKKFMLKTISKLALFQFFSQEALGKIFDWEDFNCDLQFFKTKRAKDEFIVFFTNKDIPVFSHRTYAEFLAAKWMAQKARKKMDKQTCIDVTKLVKMSYYHDLINIRLFFDSLITEDIALMPAIINRNFSEIKKIVTLNSQYMDILGRSVFHIVFSYGHSYEISLGNLTLKRALHDFFENGEIIRNRNKIILSFPRSKQLNTNIFNMLGLTRYTDEGHFLRKDKFLKLNVVEHTLNAGALAELDQILSVTNQLPELIKKTQYCLVYHAVKHHFNHILEAVKLQDSEYKKIIIHPNTSLLALALEVNNEKAVECLLKATPIHLWEVDDEGNTALHLACNKKNHIITQILRHNSTANINTEFLNKKNKRGLTALHFAARKLSKWEFNQIILCGADANSRDMEDLTPLMYAAIAGREDIVQLLVSNNVGMGCCDIYSWTALHHAIKRNKIKIIKILLESQKFDINCKTDKGMTPLMLACFYNVKQAVRLLIYYGANVYCTSTLGKTAFEIAYETENKECIDLLLQYL